MVYREQLDDFYLLALDELIAHYNNNEDRALEKMQQFLEYIEKNYINETKITQWNLHAHIDHRTNNDMESFNSLLKKLLPKNTNSNFWTFLTGIYEVQRLQDRTVNDINNGVKMRPQDKKYRDRDTEIFRLRDIYNNGQLPAMQYINDVSTLFNNYDACVSLALSPSPCVAVSKKNTVFSLLFF